MRSSNAFDLSVSEGHHDNKLNKTAMCKLLNFLFETNNLRFETCFEEANLWIKHNIHCRSHMVELLQYTPNTIKFRECYILLNPNFYTSKNNVRRFFLNFNETDRILYVLKPLLHNSILYTTNSVSLTFSRCLKQKYLTVAEIVLIGFICMIIL